VAPHLGSEGIEAGGRLKGMAPISSVFYEDSRSGRDSRICQPHQTLDLWARKDMLAYGAISEFEHALRSTNGR
jgi:hypothetical protein